MAHAPSIVNNAWGVVLFIREKAPSAALAQWIKALLQLHGFGPGQREWYAGLALRGDRAAKAQGLGYFVGGRLQLG